MRAGESVLRLGCMMHALCPGRFLKRARLGASDHICVERDDLVLVQGHYVCGRSGNKFPQNHRCFPWFFRASNTDVVVDGQISRKISWFLRVGGLVIPQPPHKANAKRPKA